MDSYTAIELAKVIRLYPEGAALQPRVQGRDGVFRVATTREIYAEVPTRLELTDRACPCDMPHCASGKVAAHLLDRLRHG